MGASINGVEPRIVDLVRLPGGDRRRQELTKKILFDWIHKFGMEYETDEYNMTTIKVPRNRMGAAVKWQIALDKKVAEERHAALVNYTNPRFQQILRQIGNGPVVSVRRVRRLNESDEQVKWGDAECVRMDVSFHVEYSSYGDTRSELVVARIGPDEFDEAIVTDAFVREGKPLPDKARDYIDQAYKAVANHVGGHGAIFCKMVGKRLNEEERRLSNHQDVEASGKDQEHHEFFHETVERTKSALGDKYAVEIRIRLVAVEPYLQW